MENKNLLVKRKAFLDSVGNQLIFSTQGIEQNCLQFVHSGKCTYLIYLVRSLQALHTKKKFETNNPNTKFWGLKIPTGRRQPVGYLWISTWDDQEQYFPASGQSGN